MKCALAFFDPPVACNGFIDEVEYQARVGATSLSIFLLLCISTAVKLVKCVLAADWAPEEAFEKESNPLPSRTDDELRQLSVTWPPEGASADTLEVLLYITIKVSEINSGVTFSRRGHHASCIRSIQRRPPSLHY